MNDKVLGFIGMGNMASAILARILANSWIAPQNVIAFDIAAAALDKTCLETGIRKAESNADVVESADMIILAVKPDVCGEVLSEVGWKFTEDKALFSIVLGWTSEQLRAFISDECPLLRVMPNTPAMIGEGMIVLAKEHNLSVETLAAATSLFEQLGRVRMLPEAKMDAATGLSGSGPAYVYLFIEALADGGVRQGLTRADAYALAAQTVLGAAKMVLETGAHPGALKDSVCSPAGSTIEGINALEKRAVRAAVIEAVCASAEKSRSLARSLNK